MIDFGLVGMGYGLIARFFPFQTHAITDKPGPNGTVEVVAQSALNPGLWGHAGFFLKQPGQDGFPYGWLVQSDRM